MEADLFGFEKPEAKTMGMIMVDGVNKKKRHPDDFYPTEPEATIALVEQHLNYAISKDDMIHEPACGDGAISKVLKEYGYRVHSTDLRDRGYGIPGMDYLQGRLVSPPVVITNPPFDLAEDFIRRALDCGARQVFMLLKSTYFHAASRLDLFYGTPLARIMPLSWRLDFTGEGRPTMECAWFEWDRNHYRATEYGPVLRKPRLEDEKENKCKNTIDLFDKK